MKKLILIITALLTLSACDKWPTKEPKTEEDGKMEAPAFNETDIVFNDNGGVVSITQEKDLEWWFSHLAIDGKLFFYNDLDAGDPEWGEQPDDIKYFFDNNGKLKQIDGGWFTIEKVSNKRVNISVEQNKLTHKITFNIDRGNAWQTITIHKY